MCAIVAAQLAPSRHGAVYHAAMPPIFSKTAVRAREALDSVTAAGEQTGETMKVAAVAFVAVTVVALLALAVALVALNGSRRD
jgi:hypothetical protein